MTLSQRIIKKWLLPPILCVSMIFTFFPQSEASAEYLGANWFATEDGKWDGTVTTTSYYNTVQLGLGILYKINRTSGHKERYFDVDPFRVRLCNKNTGNCTNYKPFSFYGIDHYAIFTNMKPGTYYIDIIDTWPGYRFEGNVVKDRLH